MDAQYLPIAVTIGVIALTDLVRRIGRRLNDQDDRRQA